MSIVDDRPRYIYALTDPWTKEVRYIGQAINPSERYRLHLLDRGSYRKARWIQSLAKHGQKPGIRVMAVVQGVEEGDRVEDAVIQMFKRRNASLTNSAGGGKGSPGKTLSPETRERIATKARGRKMSEESRNRVSARFKGKRLSAEHSARIGQRLKGQPKSDEAKARMSTSAKARIERYSAEQKAKMLAIMAEGRTRRWAACP